MKVTERKLAGEILRALQRRELTVRLCRTVISHKRRFK